MNPLSHAGPARSTAAKENHLAAVPSGCPPAQRRRVVRIIFLFTVLAAMATLWLFRGSLQNRIIETEILSNDSPPPELARETILKSADPRAALLAAWDTCKIVHRESAIRSFSEIIPASEPLPPRFDALLVSAALDPDFDVREAAFEILRVREDPRLAALADAQLRDPDHQVRQLGLDQFRFVSRKIALPAVIPLLDDGNPLIVITTLHLLENWSGERFGVKFSDLASATDGEAGQKETSADNDDKLKAGIQRAKVWWARHQADYPAVRLTWRDASSWERRPLAGGSHRRDASAPSLTETESARPARRVLPAGDFQLLSVDGKRVRLSDFRGKIVLINFWTTWCTACVSEIPSLIALQNKYGSKLTVLGISLDAIPDLDGDAVDLPSKSGNGHPVDLQVLRDKIVRTMKERGINYPVLLDNENVVGGRFNGGELPTTILVDAEGNICRRFVGARSLAEFEAMVAQLSQTH